MPGRAGEFADRVLGEVWRGVRGWPYEVSSFGRVRRSVAGGNRAGVGQVLKPIQKTNGYCVVSLHRAERAGDGDRRRWNSHEKTQVSVHRLVYETFYGAIPDGLEINHEDGDKTNNRLSNLEITTTKGNMLHAYRTGLRSATGDRNGRAKLDEEKVRKIRLLAEGGADWRQIADQFEISPHTVKHIVRRTRWEHVK